jgi:diadenylate cyclase
MNLLAALERLQFGWRDAVDILIVTLIMYQVLLLMRRTRAMQMAVGLIILWFAYVIARALGLLVLETLSREIFFYLPFVLIVLFQHEIRRALANVGRKPLVSLFATSSSAEEIEAVVEACAELARRHVGALIAFERTQSLKAYGESGKPIDAVISVELLQNIFIPNTPLHDGAVIIRGNRIVAAGAFLPLSINPEISPIYGTRHRAALGLSEETDAVIIVVSEENGSISLAVEGDLHESLSRSKLRELLEETFDPRQRRVE